MQQNLTDIPGYKTALPTLGSRRDVLQKFFVQRIGHYRNVRGLEKSMVVFRLFEKLRYSNERSTIF